MKNYFFRSTAVLMFLAVFAMVAINSCKDPEPDPIPVEDGLYIKGAATAMGDSLKGVGLMTKAKNEADQAIRTTLYEKYIALEGGASFSIINVVGGVEEVWGPGADFEEVPTDSLDVEEPAEGLWRGSYTVSESAFTVPESGLYHVMLDTELEVMAIARVKWGMIGGATPGGWSTDTEMTESAFDKEEISFTVAEVTMLESDYKFRYSGGWKIYLSDDVRVNTNFGGSLDALDAGGSNIAQGTYAVYSYTITWSLEDGTSATETYVKDGEPLPEYPEELYMIGASIGGWDWTANGIQMIPAHSNPHLFWKIVYVEKGVADAGVKFAPAKEWVGDFGVDTDAGATAGVYGKGSSNIPDDAFAESGFYMIVVNLLEETVEVNAPLVYGIGGVFSDNSWTAASATNLFTVDNTAKTVTSPAFAADGELRMHVAASTLTNGDGNAIDWWQAEFIVLEGVIEYRGAGDDQARANVTTGQTVTLDFQAETGSIQ